MTTSARLFFGWYVVAASTVGLVFGLSTFIGIGFGLFLKPLSEAFGWSRAEVSFALTLVTLVIIIFAPLVGQLIDRIGVRRLLLPSIVAFALAVSSLALLTASIFHFYAMFILIALLGLITLPASYTRVILNWFDTRRGLALGIALSGVGFGAVLIPPALQWLISSHGWRSAYFVMGVLILLICFPVVYKWLKEHPSDLGLEVDGRLSENTGQIQNTSSQVEGLLLRESLKCRAFWLLAILFLLMGVATIGTSAHLMALMTDRGISPAQAAVTMSFLGASLIAGRIVCGYLVDRYFAPYVAFAFLAAATAGLLVLSANVGGAAVVIAVALLGLGFGAEFDLMSYFISRYLGLRAYAQLYGFVYAAFSMGAGFGPLLMGWLYDRHGSYSLGLMIFAGFSALATLLLLFLGPYRFADTHESG